MSTKKDTSSSSSPNEKDNAPFDHATLEAMHKAHIEFHKRIIGVVIEKNPEGEEEGTLLVKSRRPFR